MYGRAAGDTSGLSRAGAMPQRGPFRGGKKMRRDRRGDAPQRESAATRRGRRISPVARFMA
jgi:hypothetical protein